jgi:hypothetical protein
MQLCQAALESARRAREERAFAPALRQLDNAITNLAKQHPNAEKRFISGTGMTDSSARRCLIRVASLESQREMVITAIALKRYRSRNGNYPEKLDQLVPGLLPSVPTDLMDGKPLRYRLQEDGMFLLYSIGEDGEDNGGDPIHPESASGARNFWWSGRDAVWPRPASAEDIEADNRKNQSPRGR